MYEFFEAKCGENFTFEAIYLKFDITDPHVLFCQSDTENISRKTGLIL